MIKKFFRFTYRSISALLILVFGAGLAWIMYTSANKLPLKQYFPKDQTNAVWDWNDPVDKTQKDINDLASFVYMHQLNTVYVYVDAYSQSNISESDLDTADKAMERYIHTLQKRQVRIFAVGGDVSWSNRDQWENQLVF